jgi:predicted CoA-binding protein
VSDWRTNLVGDDPRIAEILREVRVIAVLGAKAGAHEPAHYVPAYLRERGYRILPVNPTIAEPELFGQPVADTLADLEEPADVVEVFRRPEYLPGHAREILALPWTPRVVWFQLGIRHDGAAEQLARAGIQVVQNRCMMPDHRRLLGGQARAGGG